MDHETRLDSLRALLAERDLDALIAFSRADHHVDWGDAVMLLTGMKPLGPSLAVLPQRGDPRLVVTPGWDAYRAGRTARTRHVHAAAHADAALDLCLGLLDDGARVAAVDLGTMPHAYAAGVRRRLDGRLTDLDSEVYALATCKTDEEIAFARRATQISEDCLEFLIRTARPGMVECELAARLKGYSLELGADDNFMMFHAARHPESVQPANSRRFEEGDLILAEFTPSFRGQFTQVCRTLVLGEPTPLQTEKYDLLMRSMWAGIRRIAPGVKVSRICAAIDAELEAAGYGAYCAHPFINRRGHGLGTTSTHPGDIARTNDCLLQAGMFFIVHPNQYIPEVGYMLCGEPVLVTDTGFEVLTRRHCALVSIPV